MRDKHVVINMKDANVHAKATRNPSNLEESEIIKILTGIRL